MSSISIPKGSIQLAGLLFQAATPKSPALVIVHPGGGVKEQTASLYAKRLVQEGFTTVCYDASHQGESGGMPRFLEDPSQRVSDVWSVVDYLQNLDTVDPEKIGIVGICAGGGYSVAAAKSDYRLKAVAAVSMVNIGDSVRLGWDGVEDPSKHIETLKQVAAQIRAENEGAELTTLPYVPPEPDHMTPFDLREAHDYYLTPRAQHPRACNKMLTRSLPLILSFDAFHLADEFLEQPIILVVGEDAGSRWHTERLHKEIGGAERKIVVPEATHMDFYDKDEFVNLAVESITDFMKARLS